MPTKPIAQISKAQRLKNSAWIFPLILLVPLFLLTIFKISGSSIGAYHDYFYGKTNDSKLILGRPRSIRSDEFLVNTQATIAQANNDYKRINTNIGHGEDTSLLIDAPYRDWSAVFKPQNTFFLFIPFENAFALRWWFMGYMLITSVYFFILLILPKKRLFASIFATAFFFSPFMQWWYLIGTLGAVYYSLFIAIGIVKLTEEKNKKLVLIWGAMIAYFAVCFALLFYPPFQIPCVLAVAAFIVGYLLNKRRETTFRQLLPRLFFVAASMLISIFIALAFLYTRSSVIKAITGTVYPGKRVQLSGNYDPAHLLSSHLAVQFQFTARAAQYVIPSRGIMNQSEPSNFILLIPFLFLPGLYLLYVNYRRKREIDFALASTSALFFMFLVRLYIPHFSTIFKLLLLDKVPHNRLIIGIGLLGLIHTMLFIRNISEFKKLPWKNYHVWIYVGLVFGLEVWLGYFAYHRFPGFIGFAKIWLLSVPIPAIIYLLMNRRLTKAALAFLIFSVVSAGAVNPFYRGTSTLTQTPLSTEIRQITKIDHSRWVTETIYLENFASMNGAPSLSGVYSYPQLDIWKPIDGGLTSDKYNRYAHVNFDIDRDPGYEVPTFINLVGGDNFHVATEACSSFMKQNNVHYILAVAPITPDVCVSLVKTVSYPTQTFYIYHMQY